MPPHRAALAELTGGAVAVIDANLHWPTVPRPPSTPGGDDDPPSSVPAVRARAFSARAVRDGVTLVTPRLRSTATAGIELPRALLDQWSERCPHLVVDLAGFEALGNLGEAVGLVDGVLILAATGRTRDLDLLRIHAELPEACRVGVVLLG